MAGQSFKSRKTTIEDGFIGRGGAILVGLPIVIVTENGNVEPDDEWALFRLTDDGMYYYYKIGGEMAMGIMGLEIGGKPAVEEIENTRYKTEQEAKEARSKLLPEEQHRTLIRSVKPKSVGKIL